MTRLLENKKMILILVAMIILVGAGIIATVGLNVGLEFRNKTKIETVIDQTFDNKDIEQIAIEVLDTRDVIVRKVEIFEDMVAIYASSITEAQKEEIMTRINGKYELELTLDNVSQTSEANVRLRDVIKPYVLPMVLATILASIYMGIRYYKLGILKVAIGTIAAVVIAEVLTTSIYAITRISITSGTLAVGALVYVVTILLTAMFCQIQTNKTK